MSGNVLRIAPPNRSASATSISSLQHVFLESPLFFVQVVAFFFSKMLFPFFHYKGFKAQCILIENFDATLIILIEKIVLTIDRKQHFLLKIHF